MVKYTRGFLTITVIIYICFIICSCHPKNSSSDSDESQTSHIISDETNALPHIEPPELNEKAENTQTFTFPSDVEPITNIYALTLDSPWGPLMYYNQCDIRWADYMYGENDPMKRYGCGPTVIAMFASSFSKEFMAPNDAADWCAANGYWAPGSGSRHSIIPDGLSALGFQVESIRPSEESLKESLSNGKILVTLMGKGTFTQQGHFLVITGVLEDGTLRIADPASYDRTLKTWPPELVLKELKYGGGSGGPMWAVSLPSK